MSKPFKIDRLGHFARRARPLSDIIPFVRVCPLLTHKAEETIKSGMIYPQVCGRITVSSKNRIFA